MKYNYDNEKIDNTFKKIVKNQMFVDGFDEDTLTNVISVTYSDSNSSFNLNIEVRSESKVYYYQLSNHPYTGYDNFLEYLFSLDLDTKLSLNDGDILLDTFVPTSEVVTLDKRCQYLVSSNDGGTNKYFSGYYFENNGYYIYQHQELTSNPLSGEATQVVGLDSPLYGYYQSLSI